jgi:hypothetical protein
MSSIVVTVSYKVMLFVYYIRKKIIKKELEIIKTIPHFGNLAALVTFLDLQQLQNWKIR